jgi:hypothetical protein
MSNQTWSAGGGGGFLRILGITYLVRLIRDRRRARRTDQPDPDSAS